MTSNAIAWLNIIFNVSDGVFPGEYEKPRHSVSIEKKKPVFKDRKFTKGVPRSRSELYKNRVNQDDPYATRVKSKKSD
jgi:hypothetical protein